MAVFPHGINVKIVVIENGEWLVTLENHIYITINYIYLSTCLVWLCSFAA